MNSRQDYLPSVLALYALTGLTIALGVYLASWGAIGVGLPLKLAAVNVAVAAGLLLAYSRFLNFGVALAVVLAGLSALCWMQRPWLAMAAVGSVLVQLVRRGRSLGLPRTYSRWAGLLFCSFCFSVLILSANSYVDVMAGHSLLRGARPHQDTLYHASLAAMIRDYGVSSTGLHGLVHLPYHTLSHFLLSGIASLAGLSVLEAYGGVFVVVFLPLLFASLASFAEGLDASSDDTEYYLRVGFVWTAFAGFFGRLPGGLFYQYGVWDSYLVSESYALGVTLVFGLLCAHRAAPAPLRWFVVLLLLAGAGLAKVSAGAVGGALLAAQTLAFGKEPWGRRAALLGFAGILVLAAALPVVLSIHQILAGGLWNFLQFPRDWGQVTGNRYQLGFWLRLAHFGAIHFFFSWLVIALAGACRILQGRPAAAAAETLGVNLCAMLCGLAAAAFLSLPGGSTYYFTNIAMMVAVPCAAVFLAGMREGAARLVSILVFAAGLSGAAVNARSYLGRGLRRIAYQRRLPQGQGDLPLYLRQFEAIRNDQSTRDHLVYIAKEEKGFWEAPGGVFWGSSSDCLARPFLVPALAERPAIFGLPDPEGCDIRLYGYPVYGQDAFRLAAQPRVADAVLDREAARLGFKGWLDVRASGWSRHSRSLPE